MNGMAAGGVLRRLTQIGLALTFSALLLWSKFNSPKKSAQEFESIFNVENEKAAQKLVYRKAVTTEKTHSLLPDKCSSDKRIVFLKTHKTASSTVQNILMRWGIKLNKTFALPKSGKSIFRYWKSWNHDELFPLSSPADIIAHHMRFSPSVEKEFGDSAIYISIVRNPVIMFESLFNYMKRLAPQFKEAGTLETFLKRPEDYSKLGKAMTGFFAKNHLAFEFGYDPWMAKNSAIKSAIREIENRWDFVLINEYMAESLVVLRRYLCMSIEDIACFITNARASVSKLSPEIRAKLEKWNEFDWLLYNHMNETLWRKVSEIGHEKVQKEVKHLQKFVQQLTDECVEGYVDNKELDPEFRVYQPPGVKVRGIKLSKSGMKNRLCYEMAKPELPWTREIMLRQGQSPKNLEKWS